MTKTLERPRELQAPSAGSPRPPLVRARHESAKRTMIRIAAVCAIVGAAPGVQQVLVHGWRAFVERPSGVGASEGQEEDDAAAPAEPSPPVSAPNVGAPASASPAPPRLTPAPLAVVPPRPPAPRAIDRHRREVRDRVGRTRRHYQR